MSVSYNKLIEIIEYQYNSPINSQQVKAPLKATHMGPNAVKHNYMILKM